MLICCNLRCKPLQGCYIHAMDSRAAVSCTKCQPCLCFVFWHHRMHTGGIALVELGICLEAMTFPDVQCSPPHNR